MNGQDEDPHVPLQPFTPLQQQVKAAADDDSTPIAIEIDGNTTAAMPTLKEMQSLAAFNRA